MESVTYKLEVFEGPLDLLLHLVSKNKLSIYDIPIALILDQYMVYLEDAQRFNIELASEFVTMAAQLVYIKSKLLVPAYEDLEETEDPRAELVRALEYQRFKEISGYFRERSSFGDDMYEKTAEPLERDSTYSYSHDSAALMDALRGIFSRYERRLPPPASSFDGIIGRDPVPVDAKIAEILSLLSLRKSKRAPVTDLFARCESRPDAVAVFLAILELCKELRVLLVEDVRGGLTIIINPHTEENEVTGIG